MLFYFVIPQWQHALNLLRKEVIWILMIPEKMHDQVHVELAVVQWGKTFSTFLPQCPTPLTAVLNFTLAGPRLCKTKWFYRVPCWCVSEEGVTPSVDSNGNICMFVKRYVVFVYLYICGSYFASYKMIIELIQSILRYEKWGKYDHK